MSTFFPENSARAQPKRITFIPHPVPKKAVPRPYIAPGTAPVTPPQTDYTQGFYPYKDIYGDLLTALANMRDTALSGLTTDLQGRTNLVKSIVDASRQPLTNDYSSAINEAAAVNDAVANRLNSQGTSAVSDLKDKLASLGQDPTAATGNLDKFYSGLSNANYASDSGDVQRLIGRKAEELALLDKQPALIGQQLLQNDAQSRSQVIQDYLDQAFQLKQSQAEDQAQYQKDKFDYGTSQQAAAQVEADKNTAIYWDNYNKKQDLLFRRWQTQIASGDKKAANETKKQIAAAQRQSQVDIANIRAGATTSAAETRAAATKAAAQTKAAAAAAAAAKKKSAVSNINRQRAYQAALNAVIDPKTGLIHSSVNPTGYNADWTMTRIVHNTLKSFGIDPNTPQGRSVTAAVLSQAAGHKFAAAGQYGLDPNSRYKYDPNWVKAAQNAAAKKRPKERKNH